MWYKNGVGVGGWRWARIRLSRVMAGKLGCQWVLT